MLIQNISLNEDPNNSGRDVQELIMFQHLAEFYILDICIYRREAVRANFSSSLIICQALSKPLYAC